MKTLNFTEKSILKSLLDKSKTQTIRKAWKVIDVSDNQEHKINGSQKTKITLIDPDKDIKKAEVTTQRNPKFEVGDKVKIVWCEKNNSEYFLNYSDLRPVNKDWAKRYPDSTFNKNIGTVVVTEVFKIKIEFVKSNYFVTEEFGNTYFDYDNTEELAKLDGFESELAMFRVLDRIYDLSEPRELYVYRWRWIRC